MLKTMYNRFISVVHVVLRISKKHVQQICFCRIHRGQSGVFALGLGINFPKTMYNRFISIVHVSNEFRKTIQRGQSGVVGLHRGQSGVVGLGWGGLGLKSGFWVCNGRWTDVHFSS